MAADFTVRGDTKLDGSGFSEGLSRMGNLAAKGLKVVGASLAAAGVAVGALAKQSLDAYSDYEQMVGGVKTLFGTEAASVEEYAASVGKSVGEVQGEYDALVAAQADGDGEGEDGGTLPTFEARQRERELCQLRRSLDADRARLSSLRTRQAFLRNDAALKLTLLIERYRERAARYLRAVDGCRRQALCAGAEPPRIEEAATDIMRQALDGNPSVGDEGKEARA